MQKEFQVPDIDYSNRQGPVDLKYAFRLKAQFAAASEQHTPHGERLFQEIVGGTVTGPRMTATVYPYSGGEYGLKRPDKTSDLSTHFMLRAGDIQEWIYVEHVGYRRPDGYFRIAAYFDSDLRGNYAWLNNTVMLATASPSADEKSVTFTYYQVD